MKITILDDYLDTIRHLPCFQKLHGHAVTIWNDHTQDVEALSERLADTEALVLFRERTEIRRALLARLPNLKLISQRGVYPHVDVDACTEHGIVLCSHLPPDQPSYAAAELTFGLILAAARRIPQQIMSAREGAWQTAIGNTLRGKRLGIYSYGRIGALVAGYGRAFGMQVVAFGGEASRARAVAAGYSAGIEREDFFATCDFISLHIRLKPETRGIVTSADLATMQSTATLINTSRAGLIETGALARALERGRPGFAAVDVYDVEPAKPADEPLLNLPNALCTPHIGFATEEELDLQFGDIFDQVTAYTHAAPIHVINPGAQARC